MLCGCHIKTQWWHGLIWLAKLQMDIDLNPVVGSE